MLHPIALGLPDPGSQRAADDGCTCSVVLNNAGDWPPDALDDVELWHVTIDCPLHSTAVVRPALGSASLRFAPHRRLEEL